MSTSIVTQIAQQLHDGIGKMLDSSDVNSANKPRITATLKAFGSNASVIILTTTVALFILGAISNLSTAVVGGIAFASYTIFNRAMQFKVASATETVLRVANRVIGQLRIPPYEALSLGGYPIWYTVLSDQEWEEVCKTFASLIWRKV